MARFEPRDWQPEALAGASAVDGFAILAEPGLGKTPVGWTLISEWLAANQDPKDRVLVVGPKLVAKEVWEREAVKWDHTVGIERRLLLAEDFDLVQLVKRTSVTVDGVTVSLDKKDLAVWEPGDAAKRLLSYPERVHIISRDNLYWLASTLKGRWPYRFVLIDESTSFCDHGSRRAKALLAMREFKRIEKIVIMTGTPMPRDATQLWAQIYFLDHGERLGKTITGFRKQYMVPVKTDRNNKHRVFSWGLREGALEVIQEKIRDVSISVLADPYRPGKPRTIERLVTLSPEVLRTYRRLERESLVRLPEKVEAVNRGVLTSKLLQVASGSVIDTEGNPVPLHEAKLDMLEEMLEDEVPVLISVWFRENQDRIVKRIKGARRVLERGAIDAFLRGDCTRLVVNPASAGHGLDGLQTVCHHIIFYDMIHSLELNQQLIKRLDRSGQTKGVIVEQLLAEGTIDEDMPAILRAKDGPQSSLMLGLALERRARAYQ